MQDFKLLPPHYQNTKAKTGAKGDAQPQYVTWY